MARVCCFSYCCCFHGELVKISVKPQKCYYSYGLDMEILIICNEKLYIRQFLSKFQLQNEVNTRYNFRDLSILTLCFDGWILLSTAIASGYTI